MNALSNELEHRIHEDILRPTVDGLRADGIDFRGLLFPGLMLTSSGPKVLEFNARFGDPETQALLPRLRSDLLAALEATIDGNLNTVRLEWDPRPAVCVIMASGGYPGAYATGYPISGLPEETDDLFVFHAGTTQSGGGIVTNGGRVLGVTALGATVEEARARAYEAVEGIAFEGRHFRRDVAG